MAYSCRRMHTFAERVVGAARLKPNIYEEVEADPRATAQAMGVVVLSSVAGGIGLAGGQGANLIVVQQRDTTPPERRPGSRPGER